MAASRYKLIFTVPLGHLGSVKAAVFDVGAGTIPGGKYTRVCFQVLGMGEFQPEVDKGANPFVGTPGTLEIVEEMRVEIVCVGEDVMRKAVEALKK